MSDPASCRLVGRRCRLRLVEPQDYPWLRRLELGSDIAIRWRHSGAHISVEDYGSGLSSTTLAAFVYEAVLPPKSAGVVVVYGADFRNGFAYVGMARLERSDSPIADAMVAAEALSLLLDYVFQAWSFRKLYFEAAEYNLPQFSSFTALLDPQGTYQQHIFMGGRWWDLFVFALWRDEWPRIRPKLTRMRSEPSPAARLPGSHPARP